MANQPEIRKQIRAAMLAMKMALQAFEGLLEAMGEESEEDESVPDFEMRGFFASDQQRRAREAAHFGKKLDEELG